MMPRIALPKMGLRLLYARALPPTTSSNIDVFQNASCWSKIWLGLILSCSASDLDLKIAVNLNRHVLTTRRAQPQIFIRTGFRHGYQFGWRSMPR
jgi:hypothetical protein